jgi:hypothetical protein
MNGDIKNQAKLRGISRICHFTPSRNLVHIATGSTGVLATKNLKSDERNAFTPTDLIRLDNHEGHISCSIEYPNAWYFDKAQAKDPLFRDWVILLIDPKYLWTKDTLFCPRNAASARGAGIAGGAEAFKALFAESVRGAYGKVRSRSATHLSACPTDEQAEVLISDNVSLNDILGVVVVSEKQAKNELSRLRHLGVPPNRFRLIVAPILFDNRRLSMYIRSGKRPNETVWTSGAENEH